MEAVNSFNNRSDTLGLRIRNRARGHYEPSPCDGLMTAGVFSVFSLLNKTKESVWSISLRKVSKLVMMAAMRLEKYELKALAVSSDHQAASCCIIHIGVSNVLSLLRDSISLAIWRLGFYC